MRIGNDNEVHASNNSCNPYVNRAIRIATLTKDNIAKCITETCGGKSAIELSERKEKNRMKERKKDLVGEER